MTDPTTPAEPQTANPQTADEHLEAARLYTNQLVVETVGTQATATDGLAILSAKDVALRADQGRALRLVIYHGFAALVHAIKNINQY